MLTKRSHFILKVTQICPWFSPDFYITSLYDWVLDWTFFLALFFAKILRFWKVLLSNKSSLYWKDGQVDRLYNQNSWISILVPRAISCVTLGPLFNLRASVIHQWNGLCTYLIEILWRFVKHSEEWLAH